MSKFNRLLIKLLLVFFFGMSCNTKESSNKMLYTFIKKELNLELEKDFILIIGDSKNCGACTIGDIELLRKNKQVTLSSNKKYVVLNKEDELLETEFRKIDNLEILYDTNNQLERYGLSKYSLFIYYLEHGKLIRKDNIKANQKRN